MVVMVVLLTVKKSEEMDGIVVFSQDFVSW